MYAADAMPCSARCLTIASIAAFSSMPTTDTRGAVCRPQICTIGSVFAYWFSVPARSVPAAGTTISPSTWRLASDSMRSACASCVAPMPSSSCCDSVSMVGSISSSSCAANGSVALGMTRPMVFVTSLRSALAA